MSDLQQLRIALRGAGDLASGAALRLYNSNLRRIVMLEIPKPMAVRRRVSFSEAVYEGRAVVEGVEAVLCQAPDDLEAVWAQGEIAVLVDERADSLPDIRPDVLVEATISKRNVGVKIGDAPLVIGLGPGFEAGRDVHRIVESNRGLSMGKVLRQGRAEANTGVPGKVMGFDLERVLRAPCSGRFITVRDIGDYVEAGQMIGLVDEVPVISQISGVIRGLLRSDLDVPEYAKLGDVEARPNIPLGQVSDKSLALGGGILECILEKYLV